MIETIQAFKNATNKWKYKKKKDKEEASEKVQ